MLFEFCLNYGQIASDHWTYKVLILSAINSQHISIIKLSSHAHVEGCGHALYRFGHTSIKRWEGQTKQLSAFTVHNDIVTFPRNSISLHCCSWTEEARNTTK